MLVAVTGKRVYRVPPRLPARGALPAVVEVTLAHALPPRRRDQLLVLRDLLLPPRPDGGDQAVEVTVPGVVTTASPLGPAVGRDRIKQLRAEAARFARGAPVPLAVEQVAVTLSRAGVRLVDDVVGSS